MDNLVQNYIEKLVTKYKDFEKESFKLITPSTNQNIDLLTIAYPNIPIELIEILKKFDGSCGTYQNEYVCLDFFPSNCEHSSAYYLCSIEKMLTHSKVSGSWLDIYWNKDDLFDKEDILEDDELFSEEINPMSLCKDWLLFAENSYSQLYIDFSPSDLGTKGQIVGYIHDPDSYGVAADSFPAFLQIQLDSNFEYFHYEEPLPSNITSSNLNGELVEDHELNELLFSFCFISENITSLDLNLWKDSIPKDGLSKLFAAVPRTITSLRLNNIDFTDYADFVEAFTHLPINLNSLDLSDNDVGLIKESKLPEIFSNIPSGLSFLYLDSNSLNQCPSEELTQAFKALPPNIISLDLSFNKLGRFLCSQLKQIFQAIPKSVISLNLSGSDFFSKPGNELAYALSIIPESVTILNLSHNSLNRRRGSGLEEALKQIPKNVTQLDLSFNDD